MLQIFLYARAGLDREELDIYKFHLICKKAGKDFTKNLNSNFGCSAKYSPFNKAFAASELLDMWKSSSRMSHRALS